MSYEVWLFEQQPEGPSRLMRVEEAPPSYSHTDVSNWAAQMESDYAHEGLPVTSVVRRGRIY